MISLATWIALSVLTGTQPQDPAVADTGKIIVDGKTIAIQTPKSGLSLSAADYLGWEGWKYGSAEDRSLSTPYRVSADSPNLAAPEVAGATEWQAKFIIITRADMLTRDGQDQPIQVRSTLEATQMDALMQAIGLLRQLVQKATGGQVVLRPDITILRQPLYLDGPLSLAPEGSGQWLRNTLMNRGSFAADDRRFRGPYQSCFVLHPLRDFATTTGFDGVPTSVVSIYGNSTAGVLADALYQSFGQHVGYASIVTGRVQFGAALGTTPWPVLAKRARPTDAELRERSGASYPNLDMSPSPTSPSFHVPGVQLAIVDDPTRGKVLGYTERSPRRDGGFALPSSGRGQIADIAKTPTFRFWVKTDSAEPLTFHLFGPKGDVYATLGQEPRGPKFDRKITSVSLDVKIPAGRWTNVSLDLRPFAETLGGAVREINFEPTPLALNGERVSSGPVEVQFDDFEFIAEVTTNEVLLPEALPELTPANLLKATDPVRLILMENVATLKSPAFEEVLSQLVNDINGRVGASAVRALAANGSETALATLRRAVRVGSTELERMAAADALGKTGQEKYVGDLVALLGYPGVGARRSAVLALTQIPGRQSLIVRSALFNDDDILVRLAAIETSDPREDIHVRKLLWSAVNEPEDYLRAAAGIKLIQATDAKAKAEGYKVVRDESAGARWWFARSLTESNSGNRSALLLATTDSDPEVRAMALTRLIGQAEPPSEADLEGVLADPYPVVQYALLSLARSKKITLPAEVLERLKGSLDPAVSIAAKELGS
ncbi:MAG: HEAT repeat domain-containing protein [Fimbriimonas sp.]